MTRIIETPVGFDVVVDGIRFGTWRSRAEAKAGMAVEVERDRAREQNQGAVQHLAATVPGDGVA